MNVLLYVWRDGQARQVVNADPTTLDLLAVTQGTLNIYRLEGNSFCKLRVQHGAACWLPLRAASLRSGFHQ